MAWLMSWLSLTLLLTGAAATTQDAPLRKAVHASGHAWLLDQNGGLVVLRDSVPHRERVAGSVVDIAHTDSGTLIALLRPAPGVTDALVERTHDGVWRPFTHVALAPFDHLLGVATIGDDAAILTTGAVLLARRDGAVRRITHGPIMLTRAPWAAVAMTSDSSLYVGRALPHETALRTGEGLLRIDLRDGRIRFVGRGGGRRDTTTIDRYTAVRDLVRDSTNARCVVASLATAGMFPGDPKVVRVCGDSVTLMLGGP